MTWDYGTITSATPADALATKFEDAMTDSGAYTLVENYTASSVKYRVWNNSGKGFHIILSHASAGTGNLDVRLCESYNSTTHTQGYITQGVSGSPGLTTYLRSDYGYTTTLAGAATGFAITSGQTYSWTTNTTGFTYAISATSDRIVGATLVGSTVSGWHYAGKFDTFLTGVGGPAAVAEPGAFCLATRTGSFYTVTFTRYVNPPVAGTSTAGYGSGGFGPYGYFQGEPGAYNSVWDGIVVAKQYITQNAGSSGVAGLYRGLLKGVVYMSSSTSYAFGDELNVGGSPKYKVLTTTQAIEMI